MILYRLVSSEHDPVMVGQRLTRISDHSNQKLGRGMYFAMTEADARGFAASRHTHKYDHLLEVEIPYGVTDFFDIRTDQGAPAAWLQREIDAGKRPQTDRWQLKVHERHVAFCNSNGTKGLIWSPNGSALQWDELVLLEPFVGQGALILRSDSL